jgi:hypothetical protein
MSRLLQHARPVGRLLTVRRMAVVVRPGLLNVGAAVVREQLLASCGPTVVGGVRVACWPPHVAHQHVDHATADPTWRAVTHALLDDNPTFFLIVGSCSQLWPQLHPELS